MRADDNLLVHARVQNVGGAAHTASEGTHRASRASVEGAEGHGGKPSRPPAVPGPNRVPGTELEIPVPVVPVPVPDPDPAPGEEQRPRPRPRPRPRRARQGMEFAVGDVPSLEARRGVDGTNGVLRAAEEDGVSEFVPGFDPLAVVFAEEEGVAVVLIVARAVHHRSVGGEGAEERARGRAEGEDDGFPLAHNHRAVSRHGRGGVHELARGDWEAGDDGVGAVAIASGEGVEGAVHAGEHRGGSPARGSHGAGG